MSFLFSLPAHADLSLSCYGIQDQWLNEVNRTLKNVENTVNQQVDQYVSMLNFQAGSDLFGISGTGDIGTLKAPPFSCQQPKAVLKSGMSDFGLKPRYLVNAKIFGSSVNVVDVSLEGGQGPKTAAGTRDPNSPNKVKLSVKVIGIDVLNALKKGPETEAKGSYDPTKDSHFPTDLPTKEKTGAGGKLVDINRSVFDGVRPKIPIIPPLPVYVEFDAGFYLQSNLIFTYGVSSQFFNISGSFSARSPLGANPSKSTDFYCESPSSGGSCTQVSSSLASKGKDFYQKLSGLVTSGGNSSSNYAALKQQLRAFRTADFIRDARLTRSALGDSWDKITSGSMTLAERKKVVQSLDLKSSLRPLQNSTEKIKSMSDSAKGMISEASELYRQSEEIASELKSITEGDFPTVTANAGIALDGRVGGWGAAVLSIDLLVASVWAGVKGTVTILDVRAGLGASLSTKSQYVDLTATLQSILLSGSVDLIYGARIGVAPIALTYQGSYNLFEFPGFAKSNEWLVGRLDFKPPQNKSLLFWCVDWFGQIDPDRCGDGDSAGSLVNPGLAIHNEIKSQVLGEATLKETGNCILTRGGVPFWGGDLSACTASSAFPAGPISPDSSGNLPPIAAQYEKDPSLLRSFLLNDLGKPVVSLRAVDANGESAFTLTSRGSIQTSSLSALTSGPYSGKTPLRYGLSPGALSFQSGAPSGVSLADTVHTFTSVGQRFYPKGLAPGETPVDPPMVARSIDLGGLIDSDGNPIDEGLNPLRIIDGNNAIFVGDLIGLPNADLVRFAGQFKLGRCQARPDDLGNLTLSFAGRPYPADGDEKGLVNINKNSPGECSVQGVSGITNTDQAYAACQLRKLLFEGQCFPAERVQELVRLANLSDSDVLAYFFKNRSTPPYITGDVVPAGVAYRVASDWGTPLTLKDQDQNGFESRTVYYGDDNNENWDWGHASAYSMNAWRSGTAPGSYSNSTPSTLGDFIYMSGDLFPNEAQSRCRIPVFYASNSDVYSDNDDVPVSIAPQEAHFFRVRKLENRHGCGWGSSCGANKSKVYLQSRSMVGCSGIGNPSSLSIIGSGSTSCDFSNPFGRAHAFYDYKPSVPGASANEPQNNGSTGVLNDPALCNWSNANHREQFKGQLLVNKIKNNYASWNDSSRISSAIRSCANTTGACRFVFDAASAGVQTLASRCSLGTSAPFTSSQSLSPNYDFLSGLANPASLTECLSRSPVSIVDPQTVCNQPGIASRVGSFTMEVSAIFTSAAVVSVGSAPSQSSAIIARCIKNAQGTVIGMAGDVNLRNLTGSVGGSSSQAGACYLSLVRSSDSAILGQLGTFTPDTFDSSTLSNNGPACLDAAGFTAPASGIGTGIGSGTASGVGSFAQLQFQQSSLVKAQEYCSALPPNLIAALCRADGSQCTSPAPASAGAGKVLSPRIKLRLNPGDSGYPVVSTSFDTPEFQCVFDASALTSKLNGQVCHLVFGPGSWATIDLPVSSRGTGKTGCSAEIQSYLANSCLKLKALPSYVPFSGSNSGVSVSGYYGSDSNDSATQISGGSCSGVATTPVSGPGCGVALTQNTYYIEQESQPFFLAPVPTSATGSCNQKANAQVSSNPPFAPYCDRLIPTVVQHLKDKFTGRSGGNFGWTGGPSDFVFNAPSSGSVDGSPVWQQTLPPLPVRDPNGWTPPENYYPIQVAVLSAESNGQGANAPLQYQNLLNLSLLENAQAGTGCQYRFRRVSADPADQNRWILVSRQNSNRTIASITDLSNCIRDARGQCVTPTAGSKLVFGGAGAAYLATEAQSFSNSDVCAKYLTQMNPLSDLVEPDPSKRFPVWVRSVDLNGSITGGRPGSTTAPDLFCAPVSCGLSLELSGTNLTPILGATLQDQYFQILGALPSSTADCMARGRTQVESICTLLKSRSDQFPGLPDNIPLDVVGTFGIEHQVLGQCLLTPDDGPRSCQVGVVPAGKDWTDPSLHVLETRSGYVGAPDSVNVPSHHLIDHAAFTTPANTLDSCFAFAKIGNAGLPYCSQDGVSTTDSSDILVNFGGTTRLLTRCAPTVNLSHGDQMEPSTNLPLAEQEVQATLPSSAQSSFAIEIQVKDPATGKFRGINSSDFPSNVSNWGIYGTAAPDSTYPAVSSGALIGTDTWPSDLSIEMRARAVGTASVPSTPGNWSSLTVKTPVRAQFFDSGNGVSLSTYFCFQGGAPSPIWFQRYQIQVQREVNGVFVDVQPPPTPSGTPTAVTGNVCGPDFASQNSYQGDRGDTPYASWAPGLQRLRARILNPLVIDQYYPTPKYLRPSRWTPLTWGTPSHDSCRFVADPNGSASTGPNRSPAVFNRYNTQYLTGIPRNRCDFSLFTPVGDASPLSITGKPASTLCRFKNGYGSEIDLYPDIVLTEWSGDGGRTWSSVNKMDCGNLNAEYQKPSVPVESAIPIKSVAPVSATAY
jgi:hypothetical protein